MTSSWTSPQPQELRLQGYEPRRLKMAHMLNPLATVEQLYQRNSFSSLPSELQDAVFFATQCLTQAAGLLLQLPQSVTTQANVILARYWLVDPVMSHEFSVCFPFCRTTSPPPGAQWLR